MIKIGPSIISMDFSRFKEEILNIEQAKADYIHIDVMDGRFVPNLTIGPVVIKAIHSITNLPLDVHLMIEDPDCYIETYIKAGASSLIVHVESTRHLQRVLRKIKEAGVKAGVSLNPSTSEEVIRYVMDDIDTVLVMSVNPGFSGQEFIKSSLTKIARLKAMLPAHVTIAVDGGIDEHTIGPCYKNGATSFVTGSYFFKHKDYTKAIANLKKSAAS